MLQAEEQHVQRPCGGWACGGHKEPKELWSLGTEQHVAQDEAGGTVTMASINQGLALQSARLSAPCPW